LLLQDNLRRKLSTTRRPEATARNLLPELNQYKQNSVALQKQIESLMAKLNESKRTERELRSTLGSAEQRCAELEGKRGHDDKLAKTMQALQNTIDHLESRLEIANAERLDAEEQLSNLRDEKSPFDIALLNIQVADDGQKKVSIRFPGAYLLISKHYLSCCKKCKIKARRFSQCFASLKPLETCRSFLQLVVLTSLILHFFGNVRNRIPESSL
jgi:prefoldin subunit 5